MARSDFAVAFVLDGDKLRTRYKGKPMDYWNYPMKSTQFQQSKELEDRIFNSGPYIENASKYIKKILVRLPSKYENALEWKEEQKYRFQGMTSQEINALQGNLNIDIDGIKEGQRLTLRSLIVDAKRLGIPIEFYKSQSDFRSQNTANAVPLSTFAKQLVRKTPVERGYVGRRNDDDLYMYNKQLVQLYYENDLRKLNPTTLKYLYDHFRSFQYDHMVDDVVRSVKANAHNMNTKDNRHAHRFTKMMQDGKFKSIKDMLYFIYNKWKDALTDRTPMNKLYWELRKKYDES
jgi:hypothetical protein